MPMSATCTRGSVVVSRPLPSFVTRQMLPVSATPKLPPLMPMSALRNSGRRRLRANAVMCGTSDTSSSVAPSPRLEQLRDVVPALVDDRRDDVRRMVLVDLDDELAEVRLDDVDAGSLERSVELDLLAHHRLRFHGRRTPCSARCRRRWRPRPRRCRPSGRVRRAARLFRKLTEIVIRAARSCARGCARVIADRIGFRQRREGCLRDSSQARRRALQLRLERVIFGAPLHDGRR